MIVLAAENTGPIPDGAFQYLIGVVLSGGVLGLLLKSIWGDRTKNGEAYVEGLKKAEDEHQQQLASVRHEFGQRLDEQGARHQRDMERMNTHVEKLHAAIADMLKLIAPEHQAEVTAIIATLSISVPNSEPPTRFSQVMPEDDGWRNG